MDIRKIGLFLTLALLIGAGGFGLSRWLLADDLSGIVGVLVYLWSPFLAAWIVQSLIYRESTARYGWTRKHFSFSWIGLSALAPFLIVGLTLGVSFCMGNLLHVPGFGEVYSTSLPAIQKVIHHPVLGKYPLWEVFNLPNEIWVLLGIFAVAVLVWGMTLGLLTSLGVEGGFRGFLLRETQSLGFLGSNTVIGLLWGGWMALLMWMQGELTYWTLLTTFGFYLSISFPMAWLAFKARSVHAPATFIAVLEPLLLIPSLFIWSDHPLASTQHSLAVMWGVMLITGLILKMDPDFDRKYQSWVF
ncbi:MAG: hypothetical protein SF053_07040 [Bacteroidia bacterium]|nr:hypothetical protein [Bacteroidia bacterium]